MNKETKIKIGVIGTGHLGVYHIEQLLKINTVKLIGIYDISKSVSLKVATKYNYQYKRYLFISSIGGACWIISESYCTETTKYGHVIWHWLFPLGFYQLIMKYLCFFCEKNKRNMVQKN